MISLNTQNLRRSEWSVPSSVTFPQPQYSTHKNNRSSIRSNHVYPIDKNQSKTTCKKQCKLCSSIPPCVCGLLLGILTGCIILAIILAIWLIKPSVSQTNKTDKNIVAVLRWNTTGITVAGIVSNQGINNSQLNSPMDVAIDYAKNLYIADRDNHRIQKYLLGRSIGQTVAGNGIMGSSQYQLNSPSRVLIDSNENLYITDMNNNRIQFWRNGTVSGTTVAGTTGFPGNASNQLHSPIGIALNPSTSTLYVVDYGNHRIMSYASGTNNGRLVFGGTGPGLNNTQLNYPIGLHFDSLSNSLVIANYLSHSVVRYILGASTWTILAGDINGIPGTSSTRFTGPMDMTFDPMNNMYVVDAVNNRIQFFSNGQSNGTTIVGITGVCGNNATTLCGPWSARLDSQLNLYVADTLNHRIQKFLRY